MRVSKRGNSLAVRLPAAVVEALDLKGGDEIEISIAGKRDFKVARDRSKRAGAQAAPPHEVVLLRARMMRQDCQSRIVKPECR
jgi:antitoxin component of MazEF toxin-antitoxin module